MVVLSASEQYRHAEAKVKEALNLSEIGSSIFQPFGDGRKNSTVRSRSNSRVHQETNDTSPSLGKIKSALKPVDDSASKVSLPLGVPLPHE